MRSGPARTMANAISCMGEKVSPSKNQPNIKYITGANWVKMPILVESSISRALKYGMPATEAQMPERNNNEIAIGFALKKLKPIAARTIAKTKI